MAMLKFNKGELASLKNQAIVEGNVYITTDEHAMYVDVAADKRIRIGQIVEKTSAQWESLEQPYDSHTYYYITDINALVRYDDDKKKWVQINGTADIKADITDLKTRMGQAEGNISTNTTNIETNAKAIKALQDAGYQVNVVEGAKIGTTEVEIDANKKLLLGKFAAAAKTTIEKEDLEDTLKSEITTATTNIGTLTTAVNTLNGEETAAGSVKYIAKGYADSKDDAITAAQNAADAAQGTANAAVAAAATADGKAVAAQEAADANAENIGKLNTRLTNLDKATDGRVAVVEGKVGTLEGQVETLQGTTGTHTQNISDINAKIGAGINGTTLTAAIESLQSKDTAIENNISGLDTRLTAEEGKVSTLQGEMTKAKTDIVAAQKAGDDAMAYAKNTVEPIANEAKATADKNKEDIAAVDGNLGKLTTKVNTIETTYQTIAAAEAQHKEITDDIAELQAALGTGGDGAESITTRLTAVEEAAADTAADLLVEIAAREATDANLLKLSTDIGNLSNVMNFVGVYESLEKAPADPQIGDVIIVGAKEYVYADGKWNEYGDASGNASAISTLSGRVDTIESDLNTETTGLKARVTAVETKASTNKTNIDNLTTKVNGMYTNDQINALLTWGEF